MLHRQKISIIIPVLNEALNLAATLDTIKLAENIEIIIVDGGSHDHTIAIAAAYTVHIIQANAGRANQMNAGAAIATGTILLFLHGDSRLPAEFAAAIAHLMTQPGIIAGAFELQIDAPDRGLRWVEKMVNWRSRQLQLPYGDQAIFLRTATFHQLGGFPAQPIMEDFELVRRLQKLGKIAIVSRPVLTSARRWQKLGLLKTTLINQWIIGAYLLGVPPSRIAAWYRHAR